ncbi:unnamed protein product [Pocillopora meandrina]|uniref:Helix-turn-helix domain-containing protein n=1 Tax=Pocillopora meandrina TaxID=46732 RepID=A0AAU9WM83_9CNID|nr:unnamed protein product [Pocillopora meandrina]
MLTPAQMADLLTFVLRSTYFQYNGSIYEQKDGTAMGSPVSAVIPNLYMESFEKQAITKSSYEPRIWKRYVDDTFTILDRENTEKENKLAFLDTAVLREPDGRLTTSVYRKPTHTDQYLAYDSHHPQSVKRGIVKRLYERAKHLVTKSSVISEEKNICHLFWFLMVILFLSCRNLQDWKTKQQFRTRQRVQSYCSFTLCQRFVRTASPLPTTTRRTRCFQVGDYAKITASTTK